MRIFVIALRNVLRNRRTSLVTLAAIGLAVMVLVSVRGLLNGLQANLKNTIAYGQTGVVQVHKKGFVDNVKRSPLSFGFRFDEALRARIKGVAGVDEVTGRINFATMVNANDTTVFTLAFGIDPEKEYAVCPLKERDLGKLGRVREGQGVIAPDVRRVLAAKEGDELTLMAPDKEGILNAALLKVGGVMADSPAFSGDKKILFMPLAEAQALVRLDDEVTELAIKSALLDDPDTLKARLSVALGDSFEVHTWRELAKFAMDALNNQEIAIAFVIFAFSSLAAFGILNTMLMIVLARTREIGTMMAVGVRRRVILRLIVMEAGILGALGALCGALVGLGLVFLIGRIGISVPQPGASLPAIIRPFIGLRFVVSTVAFAGLVAALASLYPALRASRLTPTEALRA